MHTGWTHPGKLLFFYTTWLITAPCCFQVCSFAWNNKSSSLLFLAQEQKGAPPGKFVLAASQEIKRNTGRKARRPSLRVTYLLFLHTRKEILVAWGQIKVTIMTKACISFISTVCSCCFCLLLFSRTRRKVSGPWAPEHTLLMDCQSMTWSYGITCKNITFLSQLDYSYNTIISHIMKHFWLPSERLTSFRTQSGAELCRPTAVMDHHTAMIVLWC